MPGMGTGQLPPHFALQQGRYVIVARVGMGGMGAVYRAADTRLGNKAVAIKEMSDAAIPNPQHKQQAITAFQQEAQMLAHLDHPNLPKVMDFFTENNKHYIVMEFVDGETLESYLQRQRMGEAQVRVWAAQLFDVLDYLHHQNPPVIFRDLKPGNIMLTPSGQVKLIDFGIARLFKTGKPGDTLVMGTPGYAAPEQHGTGQTDARSDIYSLGVVLHQALTGWDPSLTPFVLPPVHQFNPSVSPQMEQAVAKAIQIDRLQRFQSVDQFRAALALSAVLPGVQTVRTPSPKNQPGKLLAVAAGAVVLLLLVITSVVAVLNLTPNPGSWLSFGRASWEWVVLGLLVVLVVIGSTSIARSRWSHRLVKMEQARHISDPSELVPSNPISDSVTTANFDSTDLRPVLEGWTSVGNREVLEDLLLQEDFESLTTWIARASGRWLLTGYGRFGGTSLVRGAITKAARELHGLGTRNAVFLYFEVKEQDNQVYEFVVEANGNYLGTLTALVEDGAQEDRSSHAKQRAELGLFRTYQLRFADTFDRPCIVAGSSFERLVHRRRYGLQELTADISGLTEVNKHPSDFQKVVLKVLEPKKLPIQVVLILDRIRHLQTLEELAQSGLFSNEKISVLAVARKEDVSSWQNAPKRLFSNDKISVLALARQEDASSRQVGLERPSRIDFRIWSIPCIWHTDFISSAMNVLLGPPGNLTQTAERNLGTLRDHLAYIGRGSLGDVLEELRRDKRPWYWREDRQGCFLRLDPLPSAKVHEIRRNAWKQQVLTLNWTAIIPDFTEAHPEYDRARLGVYYLMDWISEHPTFTFEQLLATARDREVTVSDEEDILRQTVSCLVHVLREHNNLDLLEDGRYRTQWANVNLTEAHTVECPRDQGSFTIVQTGASVSRGEVQLDIIAEADTSVSAAQAQPAERSRAERRKIVAVFATPDGSDSGRFAMESRVIRECANLCKHRNVDVVSINGAKIRDLQLALLEQDPHIVHFSGHATESGELQFEDENGKMKTVRMDALADLLSMIPSIECVILNARHTFSQGEKIESGVPFTIVMDGPISHEISTYFVRAFYDAVASGKDYADAFEFALKILGTEGFITEIAVPKLLRQSQDVPQAPNSIADSHS